MKAEPLQERLTVHHSSVLVYQRMSVWPLQWQNGSLEGKVLIDVIQFDLPEMIPRSTVEL